MTDLDFDCACGAVKWSLLSPGPRNSIRYVCHCDDCQAFAWYLGRAGEILDANGGTDVVQSPASRLRVREGLRHLACVHLTRRPTLRWYCGLCRSPVAATLDTSRRSFLSVPLTCCAPAKADQLLGPCAGHVWTRFGAGDLSRVKRVNIPAMAFRMGWRMTTARLSGDYRNNPLFDRRTGAPVASARRLSRDERATLDAEVRRSRGSCA